jgi:DsbC/DsbD-like thiol-disulfide interchange protein
VLDAEGRVTERFFEESYRTRMTGRTLALQLGAEMGSAPDSALQLSGDHLEIMIHASDPVVAPGQEFMIVIDVTARSGIHVYAPGDHPYRAVQFELEADSSFTARDAVYPEAEDYYFEPLGEHTPVFVESFRILQPVVIEASRELAARAKEPGAIISLAGAIEYQACDDKVCFLPESVPVRLTLGLRPLESPE